MRDFGVGNFMETLSNACTVFLSLWRKEGLIPWLLLPFACWTASPEDSFGLTSGLNFLPFPQTDPRRKKGIHRNVLSVRRTHNEFGGPLWISIYVHCAKWSPTHGPNFPSPVSFPFTFSATLTFPPELNIIYIFPGRGKRKRCSSALKITEEA